MLKSFFSPSLLPQSSLALAMTDTRADSGRVFSKSLRLPLFALNQTNTGKGTSVETVENPLAETQRANNPSAKKLFDRPVNSSKTSKTPKPPKPRKASQEKFTELDGLMDEQKSLSVYGLAMLVLILLMLWTGVLIVEQIQDYHAQYSELQKLKREHRKLEIEHQRLLIEQQTFSATPQIAKRAVAELNMYYPQLSDRLILQANPKGNVTTSTTDNDIATPEPSPATAVKTPISNAVVKKSEATR